jgi:transposase
VEKFPHQKIVLVLDNASYHRSRATLAALSIFEPRVRVFWLPKYCPNLNLIERFWRHLKDLACANRLEVALDNLMFRVEEIVRHQNSVDHPLKISFLENYV